MLKDIRVSALFVLCLSLIAFAPLYAGQAPSFSVSAGAPAVHPVTGQNLPEEVVDLLNLPVHLDGDLLPEGFEAKRARRELFLAVDHEQGVINAFRTYEELSSYIKNNPAFECKAQEKINEPCIFWNLPNCPNPLPVGGRAVAVACGTLAANITSAAGLNGPIQSFTLGCNNTILIPNGNCTTPPNGVSVPAGPTQPVGTCINVTNSPFNCAGCGPRQ